MACPRRRRLGPTDQCRIDGFSRAPSVGTAQLNYPVPTEKKRQAEISQGRPVGPRGRARTWRVESGEEEAAPRAELVGAQRGVPEPRRPVRVGHEHAPPGRVDDEPERDPPRHVRVRHDHPLLAAVPAHLRHAAAEEGGRQEPRALRVPLGALVEPALARVRDPAGGALQERDNGGSHQGQDGEHGPAAPHAPAAHGEMRRQAGDYPVAGRRVRGGGEGRREAFV
jgi:hypothetical protein